MCVALRMSVCACVCVACVCLQRRLRRRGSSGHPGPGCGFQMLPSIEKKQGSFGEGVAPGQRSEDEELEDRVPSS